MAAVQFSKQLLPADVSNGSVNVVAAVQPWKQLTPADVSSGRSNTTLLLQEVKQYPPAVNNSGKIKVVANVQPLKQPTPADVSSGRLNVVTAVQSKKQSSPVVVSAGKSNVATDVQLPIAATPSVVQASNEMLANAGVLNIPSCATVKTPLSVTVVNALHKLNAPASLPPAMAVTQFTSSSILSKVADVRNNDCFNVMPAPPIKVTSSPAVLMLVNAVPFAGRSKKAFQAARLFAGRFPGV